MNIRHLKGITKAASLACVLCGCSQGGDSTRSQAAATAPPNCTGIEKWIGKTIEFKTSLTHGGAKPDELTHVVKNAQVTLQDDKNCKLRMELKEGAWLAQWRDLSLKCQFPGAYHQDPFLGGKYDHVNHCVHEKLKLHTKSKQPTADSEHNAVIVFMEPPANPTDKHKLYLYLEATDPGEEHGGTAHGEG